MTSLPASSNAGAVADMLPAAELQSLGLAESDLPQVLALAETVDLDNTATLFAFGGEAMLALSLNEQRNAGELSQRIDDATNSMLKRNADLLHTNSVQAARSNQRLVIDVETLQQVQDTLLQTVQDVIKVQQEGVLARQKVAAQIDGMRADLNKRAGPAKPS